MKNLKNYTFILHTLIIAISFWVIKEVQAQNLSNCTPGWNGTVLIDCETTANWSVEASNGSSGIISTTSGFIGDAVQFNWDLGTGDWVQAKYTFSQPINLSQIDIFGLSLKGDGNYPDNIDLMFADTNDVFYGAHFDAINNITIWMKNLALPKKLFYFYFQTTTNSPTTNIDWSKINRFFVVVKRPLFLKSQINSGELIIDHLQADRAADWTRQTEFEITDGDTVAQTKAVSYIFNQQKATGLITSWKEDPDPKAWLYDQALALIVLSREGFWIEGVPLNESATRAKALADFITSCQKYDGHWPRAWDPNNGSELVDDLWVGDQAWWVIALAQYVLKSQDTLAYTSMNKGADWLISRISANGSLVPSTEGNVDTWWAMILTNHFAEAENIKMYLLNKAWDTDLHYWWRGLYNDSIPDPMVAMDCASFVGEFAKSSYVQRPEMSKDALGFVHRALITSDSTGNLCGFDGMGPVSIWCEGTAQYIVAGGEDAQQFLDMLITLQRPDGGMPGSLYSVGGNAFGWLSNWTGLSSTAWFYFALTKSPFTIDSTTNIKTNSFSLKEYKLFQNFPNPFNPATKIKYQIPRTSFVTLKLYDVLGNEISTIVNEEKPFGNYEVEFNANGLTSGIYFYKLQSGSFSEIKKMVLLK